MGLVAAVVIGIEQQSAQSPRQLGVSRETERAEVRRQHALDVGTRDRYAAQLLEAKCESDGISRNWA